MPSWPQTTARPRTDLPSTTTGSKRSSLTGRSPLYKGSSSHTIHVPVTSSPEKSLPYLLFTTSKKTQESAESFCFYLSSFRSIEGTGSHCETSFLLFRDTAWIPKTQHFCFSFAQGKAKFCVAWDTRRADLGFCKQISSADLNWEVSRRRRTYMQGE